MKKLETKTIKTLKELAPFIDYSLLNTLSGDPDAKSNGNNHFPREVFSGHYVPTKPTPIKTPQYIAHSKQLFKELGFDDNLAKDKDFIKMFSGESSHLLEPFSKNGWACGYALSIYGTEYYEQCPFQTGNGYGDGRAISIFEGVLKNKRWEMQLKGGGRTPYCRGADGRAVLRSSVREFLVQEHMYQLGIATSRSLSLYRSQTEMVKRPWFNKYSHSKDPEVMIDEFVAITTRVAPSFIRVGQLELFARRARKNEHPNALKELETIVLYGIDREYGESIDKHLPFEDKIILFAKEFQNRLITLVVNWIRVGYCQGNFNSDNCAIGGFGLDYGPFGFIDMFDPQYQPWTGGGLHFSFFNQTKAAEQNYNMFCKSLKPLLSNYPDTLESLNKIQNSFSKKIDIAMEKMWAAKLGIDRFDNDLFSKLMGLFMETGVDYTLFFRELSHLPTNIKVLEKSFYGNILDNKSLENRWTQWFIYWRSIIDNTKSISLKERSLKMQRINPKYTLREWFLVPTYEQAQKGEYDLIYELQEIMGDPYMDQSKEIEAKYYKKKPLEFFDRAGISHVSCSS